MFCEWIWYNVFAEEPNCTVVNPDLGTVGSEGYQRVVGSETTTTYNYGDSILRTLAHGMLEEKALLAQTRVLELMEDIIQEVILKRTHQAILYQQPNEQSVLAQIK